MSPRLKKRYEIVIAENDSGVAALISGFVNELGGRVSGIVPSLTAGFTDESVTLMFSVRNTGPGIPAGSLEATRRIGGDYGLLDYLCESFNEEIPCKIKGLGAAVDDEKYEQIYQEAHNLKNNCGAVGRSPASVWRRNWNERLGKCVRSSSHYWQAS